MPSIDLPSRKISNELVKVHTETIALRALNNVKQSRSSNPIGRSPIQKGICIWVLYNTSKQNEWKRWAKVRVIETLTFALKCRRSVKGPPIQVAYENVQIAPDGMLTKVLLESTLGEAMVDEIFLGTVKHLDQNESVASDSKDGVTYNKLLCRGTEQKSSKVATEHNPHNNQTNARMDKKKILHDFYNTIGNTQVPKHKLEMTPSWLFEKTNDEEVRQNWKDVHKKWTNKTYINHKMWLDRILFSGWIRKRMDSDSKQDYAQMVSEIEKTGGSRRYFKCALSRNQTTTGICNCFPILSGMYRHYWSVFAKRNKRKSYPC